MDVIASRVGGKRSRMEQEALVAIGRFTKPHGLQGEVVFLSYLADLDLLPDLTQQSVRLQQGATPPYEGLILTCRMAHNRLLMRVQGYQSMTEVETLRAVEVLIPRIWFPPLPEGEYYWFEIEGLQVLAHDGRPLGTIRDIIHTGSNDVYVVRDDTRETLVPAIKEVVRKIDLARGEVHLDHMDGLFDT